MCADCDFAKWRRVIEETLDSGVSESAANFLSSVDEWDESSSHITEPQVARVREIADEAGVDC
jgi:hypothetical protein